MPTRQRPPQIMVLGHPQNCMRRNIPRSVTVLVVNEGRGVLCRSRLEGSEHVFVGIKGDGNGQA